MRVEVTILAAGTGSRMRSNKPKVLQTLAGRTLLDHLLEAADGLHPSVIHIVVGQHAEMVRSAVSHRADVNFVYQAKRLGTGHAMQQAMPYIQDNSRVLILLGDCPLIKTSTLQKLSENPGELVVLSVDHDDPFGYGRVLRSENGEVRAIVEERDATEAVRNIKEINTGVFAADAGPLKNWLSSLTDNNAQKELLLTDIVSHANASGFEVHAYKADDLVEVSGINTYTQLAKLERAVQNKQVEQLMEAGVQIMDPSRLDVRGSVNVGRGVIIDVNVLLLGRVKIGDNVTIGPNSVIKDSVIEADSEIRANTMIEDSKVGAGSIIGPFARLRPGAELEADVHVGNFVEVKKSKIGKGSKVNHLTYLGDAMVGESVNVGAGTITCNYDGVNKHETVIGDRAFIGTNTSLVAPIEVGHDSTTGAGSTITKDVDPNTLAVGRGKQISIANWQRPKTTEPESF